MPMTRIFYITDARMPTEKAHGYQIAKMCEAFSADGREVHLVVPARKNPIPHDAFDYYGIPRSFAIHHLPVLDMVSFPFFRLFPLSLIPHAFLTASFLRSLRIFARLHLSPADIVYTRSWEVACFLRARKNIFFEVHEISRMHRFIPRLYSRVTGVIAITACLRDIISFRVREPGRILVAPDAADPRPFSSLPSPHEARHRLGLPSDGIIIGYVGMLTVHGTTEKGVTELIRAVALLHSEGVTPFLIVAGGPVSAVARYRALASSLGLGKYAIFPGHIPRTDVPLWMQASDILTIPWPRTTFSACYTSPLKLFEYMAAGKPVVISDLPALRDVADERFAVFAVPGDPASLAAACRKLMDDADLRARFGDHARRLAPLHTWDGRAAAILAFMEARCSMGTGI